MESLKSVLLSLTLGTLLSANLAYAGASTFTPKDMNTLATVATIDMGEIVISEVAAHKTTNQGVTDLANMMIMQHSANLTNVVGMPNDPHALSAALSEGMAKKLAMDNNQALTTLGALQGVQFDHAYADAMVKGHEGALNLIDTKLMGTASSPEMKTFLTAVRNMVMMHLAHAKELQKKLGA